MATPAQRAQQAFDKAQADYDLAANMVKDVPKNIKDTIDRLIAYAESHRECDAEWEARKQAWVHATKEETDAPIRLQNASAALQTAQNALLAAKGIQL